MFSPSKVALVALIALAGCGDSGPLVGECNTSGDCARGMVCVSHQCATEKPIMNCTRDEQCTPDQFCDSDGMCKGRAGLDAQLGAPDAIVSGSDDALPTVFDDAAAVFDDAAAPVFDDAGPTDDAAPVFDDAAPGFADAAPIGNADAAPIGNADAAPNADAASVIADARVNADAAVNRDASQPDAATPRDGGVGPCSLDSDCGNPDRICVSNACVLRCDRPGAAACAGTTVCNTADGRCIPGNLALGADCSLDAQCTTRLCLGLTIGATAHNVCARGCGGGNNCPLNFSCSYLSGMNFCLGENLFTPPATFDTAAGGACSSASITCQTGWCNTQVMSCIETCSREADCSAFGGNCFTYTQAGTPNNTYDHLCIAGGNTARGALCVTDAACASGICDRYEGRCAAHCCRDADCNANESCGIYDLDTSTGDIVKICAPRSAGAGVQPIGATCTSFADCESEVCGPVSLAMGAASQCSTLCCTDADCSVVGPTGRCMPLGGPTVGTVQTIVGICVPVP